MFRADILGKSRTYWALLSVKDIIEKKNKIDPADRFSIILFSEKNYELEEYVYNFADIFSFIEENAEIYGNTQLPLDRAVKSIIQEKRKIGQKIFRIIILSDGHIHPSVSNPIKIAKVAKDLGVIVDALRYGKGAISGNILKRIVEITGGSYYYINSEEEYFDVISKIATKKKLKVASLLDDQKDDTLDAMSKNIASPLLKVDELTKDQKSQINFEELKCAICHLDRCMMCETSFFGCGRYCPNCLKPIHLHCAMKWSEQQQSNSNGPVDQKVLRCPFCYYLLKIPLTVQGPTYVEDSGETNIIKMINFIDEASELMTSVCAHPDCGIMFDDSMDKYIYKCKACNNYFHTDCLKKSHSQSGKCPNCNCTSDCIDI
jgi:predicted DNA-binding ribbon-helix-helix protein